MKRLITIAAAFGSICLGSGAAHAGISITDSWSIGTITHQTGTAPNLSTATNGSSNDGTVTPKSNPYTQTLSLNTPVNNFLFVALPQGSGINQMDIPVKFTLTDGLGGTGQVTGWMNYYANYGTDIDSMAWSTSAALSPGYESSAPTLTLPFSLSNGTTVTTTGTVQLPYETDWNMAQVVTYTVTGGGSGGGTTGGVPEPASLALLGTALAGIGLIGRRRRGV